MSNQETSNSDEQPLVIDSRVYAEGQRAFYDGDNSCPYISWDGQGIQRTAWWCGYLDARIAARLGRVFKRWGLTWP